LKLNKYGLLSSFAIELNLRRYTMAHFFASSLRVAFQAFLHNVVVETQIRQALRFFAGGVSAKVGRCRLTLSNPCRKRLELGD
jgi:hypothetical protein